MDDTRNSILSLLALAHAESLPALSFADICALLPASHAKKNKHENVVVLLAQLEKEGLIISRDDWYALTHIPDVDEINPHTFSRSAGLCEKDAKNPFIPAARPRNILEGVGIKKRIEVSRQKIARNRLFFSLMQMIPFVEATLITGSVSMGNARKESDIDLLCIITKGRIWTARILLLFLAELFGKRREQEYSIDKLCFNCFAAKNALFPLQNIASAHMLARALPLFGTETLDVFFIKNAWIRDYVSRPSRTPLVASPRPLRAISSAIAWTLSEGIGNALERALARWQIRRLRKKMRGGRDATGLVLRDDVVTLYYPDNKNKGVVARYAKAMKQIDF